MQSRVTLYLSCVLKKDEIQEAAENLANAIRQKTEKQSQLDSFKTQIKAEITSIEGTIEKMSNMINSKVEFRDIECKVEYDWKKGYKTYYRLDDGSEVKKENVTADERQTHLDLEGEEKSK